MMAGCKKNESAGAGNNGGEEEVAYQEAAPSPLYALYMEVDSLLQSEDQEGATKKILEALDDETYAEHKEELFTTVIRFLVHTDQLEDAKTRFLNIIRTEPELAAPGFDLIYGHYARGEDQGLTLEWVRELFKQPLTEEMTATAREWLLVALLETGAEEELTGEFEKFLKEGDVEDAGRVARRLCTLALKADSYDLLEKLGETLASCERKDTPELRKVLLETTLMSKAARKQWSEVEDSFRETQAELPDSALVQLFSSVAQAAAKDRQFGTVDAMAEGVLKADDTAEKTRTRNAAAREWVSAALAAEKPTLVPERIGALIGYKIAPHQIYEIFNRHLYALSESHESLVGMLTHGDTLLPLLEDDRSRNGLKSLILDAAFMLDDYDRALKMLEAGMPDRDRSWHEMALTKVKAHKALQENDVDEAVRQFRAFMVIVAGSGKDSSDPASNIVHTRDMILGRNAKRIGDIYTEAGRKGEARVAYAEAKLFYEKALEGNTAGEETEKLIRDELAEVPADF